MVKKKITKEQQSDTVSSQEEVQEEPMSQKAETPPVEEQPQEEPAQPQADMSLALKEKQEKIMCVLGYMREMQTSVKEHSVKVEIAGSWLAYLIGLVASQLPEHDQQAIREALQLYREM